MPTADDYLALITPSHRGKPKFSAMIRALVEPVVSQQSFIEHLPVDFDLDEAIGAQLDVVGKWVGRTRFINIPIANVWFRFGDATRGFGRGLWKRPYDSVDGITRLDDTTYRTLLRAKIAANNWDGTLPDAKRALDIIFPNGETALVLIDNQDMTITFGVAGVIPSALFIALLSGGYIPLKPEGVRAKYRITTVSGPIFGFGVDNDTIGGFGRGAWGAAPEYFTS
ncbi:DUF2612 domain-containing protein [Bosea vaviloviae]|uniref:DUF2612 domain-containing protein n=1 Tax=Bosea vaviloviae TaxID=1526658 RepID=A0A0N1F3A2_9HYPH|nr:DUF2612 domain-containing protein [Bosea vaviloviae]KPH79309.1 hypothetical protein AE618_18560 [Bosea vaviloviae]